MLFDRPWPQQASVQSHAACSARLKCCFTSCPQQHELALTNVTEGSVSLPSQRFSPIDAPSTFSKGLPAQSSCTCRSQSSCGPLQPAPHSLPALQGLAGAGCASYMEAAQAPPKEGRCEIPSTAGYTICQPLCHASAPVSHHDRLASREGAMLQLLSPQHTLDEHAHARTAVANRH